MSTKPIEIEGDWRRITQEAARHKRHKLRLTVLPELEEDLPAEKTRPIVEVLAEIADRARAHERSSIEEKISSIMANVPDEEWAKIPPDLCDQLDHYIYGTPKRK